VLDKMLWTFSVHTAIYIKKGSVINVVCYERVCFEWEPNRNPNSNPKP